MKHKKHIKVTHLQDANVALLCQDGTKHEDQSFRQKYGFNFDAVPFLVYGVHGSFCLVFFFFSLSTIITTRRAGERSASRIDRVVNPAKYVKRKEAQTGDTISSYIGIFAVEISDHVVFNFLGEP